MELYKEILIKIFENENMCKICPKLSNEVEKIVETKCYQMLKKIKTIIEDDSLNDMECFMKIEKIICLF